MSGKPLRRIIKPKSNDCAAFAIIGFAYAQIVDKAMTDQSAIHTADILAGFARLEQSARNYMAFVLPEEPAAALKQASLKQERPNEQFGSIQATAERDS